MIRSPWMGTWRGQAFLQNPWQLRHRSAMGADEMGMVPIRK